MNSLVGLLGLSLGVALASLLRLTFPGRPSLPSLGAALAGQSEPFLLRNGVEQLLDGVQARSSFARRLLGADLLVTGRPRQHLLARVGVGILVGACAPLLASVVIGLWLNFPMPLSVEVVLLLLGVGAGVATPCAALAREAERRRRHFRTVLSCFVDLAVLGLAGGVGIEGALMGAAAVSDDWATRMLAGALTAAREGGHSPWRALGRLGLDTGVHELVELSATVQLAGMEGARVRQSLAARAEALRRHEQADQESAANAATERLFLPGALLLVGFLIFIGFPACSRIFSGL